MGQALERYDSRKLQHKVLIDCQNRGTSTKAEVNTKQIKRNLFLLAQGRHFEYIRK